MSKVATIHQPNYLPWLGLFGKIQQADCWIVADDFQFSYQSVINRTKIRTREGWIYLTIPVGQNYQHFKINEVPVPKDKKWKLRHWNSINAQYSAADYYNAYKNFFKEFYHKEYEFLWQANMEIIQHLLQLFEINVEIVVSSELDIDPRLQKTDYMIALLKSVGTDEYLSGPSGKIYLEYNKFEENNIDLKFFKFQHPVYRQRYPGFEPAMSAIDLLFNAGKQSSDIIKESGSIEN